MKILLSCEFNLDTACAEGVSAQAFYIPTLLVEKCFYFFYYWLVD